MQKYMRNFDQKVCSMQFSIGKGPNFQNLRDLHGIESKVRYLVKIKWNSD
jgi:hypothetical protein